jgi:hypothetical protein
VHLASVLTIDVINKLNMDNLILWEVVALVIGLWATYLGVKTLRQSDKDFLADWERSSKKNAKYDGITEEEAMRRYMGDKKRDPRAWRWMFGGRALAVGVVALTAFLLLVMLDIST